MACPERIDDFEIAKRSDHQLGNYKDNRLEQGRGAQGLALDATPKVPHMKDKMLKVTDPFMITCVSRSFGTCIHLADKPKAEALGYCQISLWEKDVASIGHRNPSGIGQDRPNSEVWATRPEALGYSRISLREAGTS